MEHILLRRDRLSARNYFLEVSMSKSDFQQSVLLPGIDGDHPGGGQVYFDSLWHKIGFGGYVYIFVNNEWIASSKTSKEVERKILAAEKIRGGK